MIWLRRAASGHPEPAGAAEGDVPDRQREGCRILNRAVFGELLISHDGDEQFVSGDDLNEPFDSVITYHRRESRG